MASLEAFEAAAVVVSLAPPSTVFFHFFVTHVHDTLDTVLNVVQQLRVMTSTSPTPDIASLSLSSHPAQQRPHDPYDYDGLAAARLQQQQYHFQTSPAVVGQVSYNSLSMNASPLKNKPSRAGLPTVRLFSSQSVRRLFLAGPLIFFPCSNGSRTRS